MIAFGCSITDPAIYREHAAAGIERAREADSVVFANAAAGGIARSYNLVLEQAAPFADLEALVLLHQDAEIVGDGFTHAVREGAGRPPGGRRGLRGRRRRALHRVVGGRRDLGDLRDRLRELGAGRHAGGRGRRPGGGRGRARRGRHARRVRPRARALGGAHPALRRVPGLAGVRLRLRRVRPGARRRANRRGGRPRGRPPAPEPDLVTDEDVWTEAYLELAEKWQERLPGGPGTEGGDARQRARRAEAEAGVAKLAAMSKMLQSFAQAGRHEATYAR
jgi:hypothetical protein